MRKSIFAKYFTIVASIVFACVVVFSSIVIYFSRSQWIEEKNTLLSRNTQAIATEFARTSFGGYVSADVIDLISGSIDASIFVVDGTGQCIYLTTDNNCKFKTGDYIDKTLLKEAMRKKQVITGTLNDELDKRCFIVSCPIDQNGFKEGAVFATVPMRTADNYVADIFQIIMLAAIFVMLVALIATYIASAQMTRPLRQMAQVIKKVESGDFSARVLVERRDEIGLLAESLNKMLVSIGALENMRRNFISSVSHELKTPMTTISGFVDGILDGTIPREESDKYLMIVSDETKRLSRLVNSMLQLSRLESEKMKLNKTTFNLSDMIISVFLSFEHKIEEKKLEIVGLDLLHPISLTADRDLIYQVVYNLTENAIKFTPEGGTISVFCESEKQTIKFSIKNTGEGLQQREMAKIFDRFYKTDRSRSKDKTGMGFGLYIVKTIIGLHGGKITVGSVLSEYTQFDVYLPDREVVAEIDSRKEEN